MNKSFWKEGEKERERKHGSKLYSLIQIWKVGKFPYSGLKGINIRWTVVVLLELNILSLFKEFELTTENNYKVFFFFFEKKKKHFYEVEIADKVRKMLLIDAKPVN